MQLISRQRRPEREESIFILQPADGEHSLNIRKSATLEVKKARIRISKKRHSDDCVCKKQSSGGNYFKPYLQESDKADCRPEFDSGVQGRLSAERAARNRKRPAQRGHQRRCQHECLELGVDIGQLQTCIMTGYPGMICKRLAAGRPRRKKAQRSADCHGSQVQPRSISTSCRILDYFFKQNPETAVINPDNLVILVDHIKCAAFELPFKRTETFGRYRN